MYHKKHPASIPLIFLFLVILAVSVYVHSLISFSQRAMEYNIERRLIAESIRLSQLAGADELARFDSADDMALPEYQALRQRLLDFSIEADILYAYYLRPSGDKLQYIADNDFNEETRVGLDTPPFDPQFEPWLLAALEGQAICAGLGNYTDGWEGLISGYAPIFDRDGAVAALAGVDIEDKPIVWAKRMIDVLTVVQIVSVAVILATGIIYLRKKREIERFMKEKLEYSKKFSDALAKMTQNPTISAGNLKEAADIIAKTGCHALGASRVGIWRYAPEANVLKSIVYYDVSTDEYLVQDDFDLSRHNEYHNVLRSERLVVMNNPKACGLIADFFDGYGRLCAAIDVPIRVDGKLFGVVCVEQFPNETFRAGRDWTTEEQNFTSSLADLTALAISGFERREAQRAAEEANRSKSNFLAKMSHEIRTPMNAITGMAELALREDLPDAALEYMLTIKQAGANLLAIINEILDFSKIESGKLEIVPGDYLFSSLLNDVISIIRMRVLDSAIRFVVNIDRNIPNALYGDEIRIRQVFLNILSNAVKYTDEGYVSFTVTGETAGDTVTLTVEVTDSGRGMSPEDVEKLFGDFVQVDLSGNKGIEGTGLGLAIARSLVNAMDGDIAVSSEYGAGSTFTVTLPQKIRDPAKIASVENPERKRVLVYEPRDIYADSIVCTIDNLGVACTLVSSDAELREEISGGQYTFVFVASTLYENKTVREICGAASPGVKTVILAGFGEVIAERNLGIISMPVHSISVANILNGVDDGFSYNTSGEFAAMFTAPEANVLVVDDVNTNLSVAHGLLLPYKLRVDLRNSGAEAIEAVTNGRFDLILMDHMMPGMDGMEAVARIRALPGPHYQTLPIVALTANAVSGAREMFLAHGFNDFLSKPIDTLRLNTVLEKWIPKEKQHKAETGAPPAAAGISPKLLQVFRADAEKAIPALRETAANGDTRLFATTAHAMKSALANVGENKISALAFALEKAGLDGDEGFIAAHTESFIAALETLIASIRPPAAEGKNDTDIEEDRAFFAEQLSAVKAACECYDDTAAYAALDRLGEKPWRAKTAAALEQIRDSLFLHSDFEEAGARAQALLEKEG